MDPLQWMGAVRMRVQTCLNDGFVSYKHTDFHYQTLTDEMEWCVLLWCFYQLFGLSFWRHQSQRQRNTDEGAAEVTKGGDYVAQSKNKK